MKITLKTKSGPRGRPRKFNREEALGKAMHLFWQKGFEATSLEKLTRVMGLSASSLYAAFGSKEQLYLAAAEHFVKDRSSYTPQVLDEAPDGYTALQRLFRAAAVELTRPDQPHGCMVTIALGGNSPEETRIQDLLKAWRIRNLDLLGAVFARDLAAGRLPPSTDTHQLASFFTTVLQGMSVRARDGATRRELEEIGQVALHAWPAGSNPRR